MNSLDHLEAKLFVEFGIGGVAALEIAQPILHVALEGTSQWLGLGNAIKGKDEENRNFSAHLLRDAFD